jgi:RNA-directed DNA polymerase
LQIVWQFKRFRLVEVRWRFTVISKWIRRHVRKLFWQRWHKSDGRRNALRRLGLPPHQVLLGGCGRGAWRMAAHAVMHTALNNKTLIKYKKTSQAVYMVYNVA